MTDQSFRDFVAALAARTPAPGGGAAAAHAGAMGAALLTMVVRFCRGKKANAAREDDLAMAEAGLDGLVARFLPMAERDAASFGLVMAAYALPKSTDDEVRARERAVQASLVGAMVVPEETVCLARDALATVEPVIGCVGRNIVGDLGAGAALLATAAGAAELNVRINASYLADREAARVAVDRVRAILSEISTLQGQVDARVDELIGGDDSVRR
jgi:formiminotetrahydrofolate cyclodeaminase